jgi:hypothetical protein
VAKLVYPAAIRQLKRSSAKDITVGGAQLAGEAIAAGLVVYGSEAPIFHPQWALRAFMDFQIPEDLCQGYGYPQLTDQAKRKILGENLLRLHGMDVQEARATLGRHRS